MRIFEGPVVVRLGAGRSGTVELEREEAAVSAFSFFFEPLEPALETFVDEFPLGFSTSVGGGLLATEVAYAESFSPTQDCANHLPPAMPRISRLANRQWRTCVWFLSRGRFVAKPVVIFTGGSTGKGFDGRGYTGQGTPSRFSSWLDGVGTDIGGGPGTSIGSRLGSLTTGDEGAVPVNAVTDASVKRFRRGRGYLTFTDVIPFIFQRRSYNFQLSMSSMWLAGWNGNECM